jgi:hypothetical protein
MSSRFFRIGRSMTGLGMFATKSIKRGTYIATYRGRRITTEESDRREERGARYMFALNTMGDRRRAAMEGGSLYQPLLSTERETCRP